MPGPSAAATPALAAHVPPILEPPTAEPPLPLHPAPLSPPPLQPPPAQVSETVAVPSFALNAPEQRPFTRYWPQVLFVILAIALLGYVTWTLSNRSSSATAAAPSPVKAASWSYQPVALAGRSLNIYEPSRGQSDYRIEFSWIPDTAGVGWVFRTRDGNNYYAQRLSLQQKGAKNLLLAEHFSVFGGKESAHSRKLLPLEKASGLVRIHMDAIGPAFKLFVENDPADNWNDARLPAGAIGFYKDGAPLPKLLAISFTFVKNSGSRTALVSLP